MMCKSGKRSLCLILILGALVLCGCSCSGRGYEGGLGGILPRDFRQEAFTAYVRGEMCCTAQDGYLPPDMTPMAGMGVSATGVPLPFEAEIQADTPVDGGGGVRSCSVTYTAPHTLRGVRVDCRGVFNNDTHAWDMTYTLSYTLHGEILTFPVAYEQAVGLLSPVMALLPRGDVTNVSKDKNGLTEVTFSGVEGLYILTFDTHADTALPVAVTWEREHGRVKIMVS